MPSLGDQPFGDMALVLSQKHHQEEGDERQGDEPGGWQEGPGQGQQGGKTYLGPSQSPTATQLLPEQPVTADVVGPASGKLFLSPFTPPHPLDDRGASSHPPTDLITGRPGPTQAAASTRFPGLLLSGCGGGRLRWGRGLGIGVSPSSPGPWGFQGLWDPCNLFLDIV